MSYDWFICLLFNFILLFLPCKWFLPIFYFIMGIIDIQLCIFWLVLVIRNKTSSNHFIIIFCWYRPRRAFFLSSFSAFVMLTLIFLHVDTSSILLSLHGMHKLQHLRHLATLFTENRPVIFYCECKSMSHFYKLPLNRK